MLLGIFEGIVSMLEGAGGSIERALALPLESKYPDRKSYLNAYKKYLTTGIEQLEQYMIRNAGYASPDNIDKIVRMREKIKQVEEELDSLTTST